MSKYATMVPARIRVETRPRSLAVPASWPRCSISCTVRCESCDQRETLAEAGINYVLSGHGLSNGHHCRICGRVRPNEQFPGKGHKIHVCKRMNFVALAGKLLVRPHAPTAPEMESVSGCVGACGGTRRCPSMARKT